MSTLGALSRCYLDLLTDPSEAEYNWEELENLVSEIASQFCCDSVDLWEVIKDLAIRWN